MSRAPIKAPPPLAGWYVISLRPVGQHGTVRRAAARLGARTLGLSGLRLIARDDAATRAALRRACGADLVIVTSPAAARYAARLRPLRARRGQRWCAVGAGTRAALWRAGIVDALAPQRMDAEGLLALPELVAVRGRSVGLITAPGGRGLIATTLHRRGAALRVAEVYERRAARLDRRHVDAVRALPTRAALLLSSAEALEHVFAALPEAARRKLLRLPVVASSERLAELAGSRGFAWVLRAASARPTDLLAALATHART